MMSQRVSDGVAEMVKRAIGGLPVLQTIKDEIDWEVIPALQQAPDGSAVLVFMIGIGLPIPGTGDRNMPFAAIDDDREELVALVVRQLYGRVQADLDKSLPSPLAPGIAGKTSRPYPS